MSTLALAADERVADVTFTEDEFTVRMADGRAITVPLVWYPRLLKATPEQRNNWKIAGGGYGVHWEDIDEDLSTEGLLRGAPARSQFSTRSSQTFVAPEDITASGPNHVITAERANEDDEEKGYLDLITEGEEASEELTSIVEWIASEIESIGSKARKRTEQIEKLKMESGGTSARELKKVTLLAASDINVFSKRIEDVLPRYGASIEVWEKGLTAVITTTDCASVEGIEQLRTLRRSIDGMFSATRTSKESVMSFRDVSEGLASQRINKELTKAARRQAQALQNLIAHMEHTETFALRVTFQIDEKLKAQ